MAIPASEDHLQDSPGGGVATLVHYADAQVASGRRDAVLHLHGFVDYFFQDHHAARWAEQGQDLFALDLRDCGRSIRPGRIPSWITDLRSYDLEIDAALAFIRGRGYERVVLQGHSTGGLIATLYLHEHPGAAQALVLNSPWFELNRPWPARSIVPPVVRRLGQTRPFTPVASLGDAYGRSLHESTGGSWEYELAWKPLEGFPILAGWLRAVVIGHARVARGLAVVAPTLVATSGRSGDPDHPSEADRTGADCVLDVRHMWARAPLLGPRVRVLRVPGGRHDLTLSEPPARRRYENALFSWLADTSAGRTRPSLT